MFEAVILRQTNTIISVHYHPHIFVWVVIQGCTVFASSESSRFSTNQVHLVKLPDVRSVFSFIHALDQFANFVFTIFLTIFCRKFDIYESVGCSLKMCSADVVVSQF